MTIAELALSGLVAVMGGGYTGEKPPRSRADAMQYAA